MQDLTAILYTANTIPAEFALATHRTLMDALQRSDSIGLMTIAIEEGVKPSHLGIYRQALQGARQAVTKYIALCEDDVLYSPEHFKYRPSAGVFAYNMNAWNIYTWTDPMFTQKPGGRKNLNGLICERELFIEAMEERFAKWPDDDKVDTTIWGEPGKYEGYLGVTKRSFEEFHTNPPNIIFSHENELSFAGLGKRKKLGQIRATEIPYWGTAKQIRELYQ